MELRVLYTSAVNNHGANFRFQICGVTGALFSGVQLCKIHDGQPYK